MRDGGGARRRWIRASLWVGLAGATAWLWLGWSGRVPLTDADLAPAGSPLRVLSLEGERYDVASLRGQVVVLHLWASWCPPCRTEMPAFNRLHRDMASEGVIVLGLNVEGLPESGLSDVTRKWDIPFPVVVPIDRLAGTTFEGEGILPHTWLIDRAGRVRASVPGPVGEAGLRVAVRRLLDES